MLSPGDRHRFKKQLPARSHSSTTLFGIWESILIRRFPFLTPIMIPFCLSLRLSLSCTKISASGTRSSAHLPVFFTWIVSCFPAILAYAIKRFRPFQKCRPLYSLIFHNHLSPVLPGISPSLTFSSCLASSFVR